MKTSFYYSRKEKNRDGDANPKYGINDVEERYAANAKDFDEIEKWLRKNSRRARQIFAM